MDTATACYRFAGALGLRPQDLDEASCRDLWQLYCGRLEFVRRQVLYQSSVLFAENLDVDAFIRRGDMTAAGPPRLTMSENLKASVEEEIGRMNRERAEREKASGG